MAVIKPPTQDEVIEGLRDALREISNIAWVELAKAEKYNEASLAVRLALQDLGRIANDALEGKQGG